MNEQDTRNQRAPAKKPYSKPILRVYGRLQDFTKETAHAGVNSDTRGFNMDSRTH
jgi:hypothetical protein